MFRQLHILFEYACLGLGFEDTNMLLGAQDFEGRIMVASSVNLFLGLSRKHS